MLRISGDTTLPQRRLGVAERLRELLAGREFVGRAPHVTPEEVRNPDVIRGMDNRAVADSIRVRETTGHPSGYITLGFQIRALRKSGGTSCM